MATIDNRFPTEGTQIDIEARLAAIETALASLMADTTGQSIASAISGLGATLGSDKANISGDNIASPATFRQNIEASKLIAKNVLINSGQTITAGTGYNVGSIRDLTNGAITSVYDLKSLSVIYMAGDSGYDYTAKVFTHASLNTIRVVPTITQSDVTIRISLGF